MVDWRFPFFYPQFDFLNWIDLLKSIWLISALLVPIIAVLIYYFLIKYSIVKNKSRFYITGLTCSLLLFIGVIIFLLLNRPIESLTTLQALNVSVHILVWSFGIYFTISLMLKTILGKGPKRIGNGFLHKKNVPF